ncbi:MAG TPA: glycogen synthase GlgA [Pseudomonadales bacterium]|nr:glycogen synthase GlgA [Pseudomonadales bacterium]
MYKVLFVTSECWPLIKTGGLADISYSLPLALKSLGHDVITLLPAYQGVKSHFNKLKKISSIKKDFFAESIDLLEGVLEPGGQKIWLIDLPSLYDRQGGPYLDQTKNEWSDNSLRFALLCRVACEIAMGRAGLDWRPDVVHGNDWQSGLVPAFLSLEKQPPATLFTIHNIAYQGIYMRFVFDDLKLPDAWWHYEALEYYGNFSFLKAALVYSDYITTVSPSYAEEIKHADKGCGLDGVLRQRAAVLSGIVNGIDEQCWNPAADAHIKYPYDAEHLANKRKNKQVLQRQLKLASTPAVPLIGVIGRFAYQKGIDLVIEQIQRFKDAPCQWVILGNGDLALENDMRQLADKFPGKVSVTIGYDETLAHQIEAGADLFLMPSRYEPCGLNQMYSLRYGTVPIVTRTGGLMDTVVDLSPETLAAGSANGFWAAEASADALTEALERALAAYENKALWLKLRRNGMTRDFSWQRSAEAYVHCYEKIVKTGQNR